MTPDQSPGLPEVTPAETIDEIVAVSRRTGHFPLRREFLQRLDGDRRVPGPFASLVTAGDLRALQLYLLLVTKASSDPWNARLPAAVWARALGITLPTTKTARSTVSKIWLRLADRNLVARTRTQRLADVRLLREDGSGVDYTSPGAAGETYFRVPLALWQAGPEDSKRWYQILTLPELAVTLIARSLGDNFRLPYEMGPEWYGISADTISRGVQGLAEKNLLKVDKRFKKAPLSPVGYTAEHRYTLQEPLGPVGRRSGARAPTKPSATKSARHSATKAGPRRIIRSSTPRRRSGNRTA